jgi:hypothetical protein
MTEFDEQFLDEDCVDCNENASKLMKEIEEGLEIMESMESGITQTMNAQDIIDNNIVTILDENGNVMSAVPECVLQNTLESYRISGFNIKKWRYTRVFRQAEQFVERIDEHRERLNEQNRNLNPESTSEQSGIPEEGDTLPEEGLFRVDLNEDLLRQHQELCSEL